MGSPSASPSESWPARGTRTWGSGGIAVVAIDLLVLGDVLLIDEDGAANLEGVCHLFERRDTGGVQLGHLGSVQAAARGGRRNDESWR